MVDPALTNVLLQLLVPHYPVKLEQSNKIRLNGGWGKLLREALSLDIVRTLVETARCGKLSPKV